MTRSAREYFTDAPPEVATMSPVAANLLRPKSTNVESTTNIDILGREMEMLEKTHRPTILPGQTEKPRPVIPGETQCPKCPVCPDMSQYVKLSEVPCWNCSLQ